MPPSATIPEETAYVFAPIVRKVRDDKGFLTVYGKLTGNDLDLAGQRCDPEWLKSATPSWFNVEPGAGNIREMHQLSAVGKAKTLEEKDDGWYISAKVVDPLAITKVEEGVYSGLSIGIAQPVIDVSQKALATAPNGIIKGGSIIEGSLVDRPCLPSAKLDRALVLAKRAEPGAEVVVMPGMDPGAMQDKGLLRTEEIIDVAPADAELIKVDSASGGHSHEHSHGDAGSHTHEHTHNPLPTIRSHETDAQPHSHTHTDSDPELTQDAGAAGTEDTDANEAPSGVKAITTAPGLGIGDSDAFHREVRARMNKAAPPTPPPVKPEPAPQIETPAIPAPEPVAKAAEPTPATDISAPAGDSQVSGAALVAELAKALKGSVVQPGVTKADQAPNKLHAFVDKNDDGKCDACGKAMGDGMHRRPLPGTDSKAATTDPVAAALLEMRSVLNKALGVILGKADSDAAKKPVGLTDAIKKQYVSDLANTAKNSTQDVSNATRRMSQWAAQGAIPTGLTYADLKWMYNQAAAELQKRNPKSKAGGNFPALGSGKGVLPDLGLLEKCQAMQDALTAAASTSEGEDTRKAAVLDMGQAILKAKGIKPDLTKAKAARATLTKGVLPYAPQPYSAGDDETVVCTNCGRCNDTDAKNCDQCGAALDPTDAYSADDDEIVICPVCGLCNDTDASFCDQDGTQLIGRTDVVLASAGDAAPTDDGVDHTDAYRQTIQGLSLLIQQEAQEMATGDDEWACLCRLIAAYKWILAFLAGEQAEGELLATFSPDAEVIDVDGDGFTLANMVPDPGDRYAPPIPTPYLGFSSLPDLVKALQAEIAKPEPTPTPEATKAQEDDVDLTPVTDQIAALAKAMEPVMRIEALIGKVDDMGARLERIEQAPVANGPRRTPPQSGSVPSPRDEIQAKVDHLTKMAEAPGTSPVMAEGYRKWAAELKASLAH